MQVSRSKKIRFVNEFGPYALMKAVEAAFLRHGPDWLTDEQLDEITKQQISDWREQRRRHRQSCKAHARRAMS